MIQRFLEDPLILLSTIKDDDHLAAYKVPKFAKNAKYLQLIHRRKDQYVYFVFVLVVRLVLT
jgi:ubiquitin carboxyl-terminal hydrolase 4/11/15